MTTVHHEDDTLRVIECDNLLIARWLEAPTEEQMVLFGDIARPFSARHPGGSGFLNLMVRGRPSFTPGVRREAEKLSADPSMYRLASVHVVLAPGLVSTATRAFLSTVFLVARPPRPTRAFGSLAEALPWLLVQLDDGEHRWTLDALRRAVHAQLDGLPGL